MSEYTISKRAMELLQAANKPLGVSTTGKGTIVAIKALQRQGLVEIWKDGKARTTELGREFLISKMGAKEEEHAAPADDPRIEVVNQPIREPEPEPEPGPSSNGVVHETIDAETAALHTFGGCSCAHRRALEYLMEQVPDLRDAVDQFFALEKSVARLQGSAVTHRG